MVKYLKHQGNKKINIIWNRNITKVKTYRYLTTLWILLPDYTVCWFGYYKGWSQEDFISKYLVRYVPKWKS
jgi:hypothetical protein